MRTETVEAQGRVATGFEPVREAFAENFQLFPEIGSSVAMMVDGELVVDLWAGHTDLDRTQTWQPDTIVNVWSSTKGPTALAAHMLAERGMLDFEAPVARYWPEFAQQGKGDLPVRYLLTHQSGLHQMPAGLPSGAAFDWQTMVDALAAQQPAWEPGSKHQYEALTFGWLVGELIRRVSGGTPGEFVRDEIAGPLGIDFFIGLPADEDRRVATIRRDERQPVAPSNPIATIDWNSRECRAAEIPAANGHSNARALATIYGALARGGELGGVRLLEPASVERAAELQVDGVEESGTHMYRTLGFMRPFAHDGDMRPDGSFGHAGAGGSQGFADPEAKVGFGYAMNQMLSPTPDETRPSSGGMDPRGQRLVKAFYAVIRP